jgi:hypothetical protein
MLQDFSRWKGIVMMHVQSASFLCRRSCIVIFLFLAQWGGVSSAGPPPIAPPARSEISSVEFKGGKLSVSASNADLTVLLKEVGKKAGIQIVLGSINDQKVTASFKDLGLESGLRKILRGQNYYLFFSAPKKGEAGSIPQCDVSRVVLLNKGGKPTRKEGAQVPAPVPITQDASSMVGEIIAELLSEDTHIQAQGLERLGRSLEAIRNVDPEIMGALRLVIGEETRNSGLAGLREILKKAGSSRDAVPTN